MRSLLVKPIEPTLYIVKNLPEDEVTVAFDADFKVTSDGSGR